MKKSIILACLMMMSMTIFGQNNLGSADDAARIAITPYVDPSLNFNKQVSKQLTNKMTGILTKQGLAGSFGQRFIITANVDINSEDIVVTTTEMYQYELTVNFIIGDGFEGTKFAMVSQEVKGLGETKADAYLAAIKKIKTTDPAFQTFIEDAKVKIIEYYNSKCDFIISEAQALAKQKEYDAAIFKLTSVPDVCKDCYNKCMTTVQSIYQEKIDGEGAKLLAEAKAVWAAGLDVPAAEAAAEILSQIDPSSKAYAGAGVLTAEISKRVKELDKREWNFQLKQHQDNVDLRKASIKAVRDIGVAYGKNQQPTYHVRTWW